MNCFHCSYPIVSLVPRYNENQLISAINIKSPYGITIHVIKENQASCCAISRNWNLKFCVFTLSHRWRLYIHVVSCKGIIMIMITHQTEPPSPIQALGVNPFPSRVIIRTDPRRDYARRRWEEPITTTKWRCYNNFLYFIKQPEIRCWQAKHNHKLVKRDFSLISQRFSFFAF